MAAKRRRTHPIDPQLPNANGSNPGLKLRSVSQNLNWHTAAAKFKSASIRVP